MVNPALDWRCFHESGSSQITAAQSTDVGKIKVNLAPPNLELLSARSWPPCASMIDREIRKPMPVPVSFVVKKLSKRTGRMRGSIPGPLDRKSVV